jgi:hypothetical protein
VSPWTDLTLTGPSFRLNAAADPLVNVEGAAQFVGYYVAGADPRSPYISPLYGNLTGLPPTIIQVGSDEVLRDDSPTAGLSYASGANATDGTVRKPAFPPVSTGGLTPVRYAKRHIGERVIRWPKSLSGDHHASLIKSPARGSGHLGRSRGAGAAARN